MDPKFSFIPRETIRIDPPAHVSIVHTLMNHLFNTQEKIDALGDKPTPIGMYETEFTHNGVTYMQNIWVKKTKTQLVFGGYAPIEKDDKGAWKKYAYSEYKPETE